MKDINLMTKEEFDRYGLNITVLQCYNVTTFYKNGTMYTGI